MKRLLALLLALILVIGILPVGVFAEENPTIALTADVSTDLKIGDEFTVTASLNNNTGFATLMLKLLWNSAVLEFSGFETEFDEDEEIDVLKDTILGGTIVFSDDTAMVTNARYNNSSKNGTVFTAKFRVVGYGDCDISFDRKDGTVFEFRAIDATDNTKYNDIDATIDVTAVENLTVTDPNGGGDGGEGGNSGTTTDAPYEIWYELDSTADTETTPDGYKEYDISTDGGKTVTATVKIKNKGTKAVSLQAYDIYLTHDSKLTPGNTFTPKDDNYNVSVKTIEGGLHLQAIGSNTDTEGDSEININLPVYDENDTSTVIELGTITFTINDTTAEYGEELEITLTPGSKDVGASSTNIGIADYVEGNTTTTGNKNSYYPSVAGDVLGAEVNTKHTITWKNDDGTTLGTTEVGHNVMPEYSGTPTKEATAQYTYTFAGWTPKTVVATKEATYTATYTSTTNSYTVTWNNWDNTELDTDIVAYGATPNYSGETPTKAADDKYTYIHSGWTPAISAVTGEATYTATYTASPKTYKITFTVGEGKLPEGLSSPMSYDCDDTTALPQPTRDGYKFNGWLLETAIGGWEAKTYSYTDTVTGKWGDVTLVAQWLDASFDVKFGTSENGSVSASPLAGDEGTEITLTATPHPGYKLAENGFNVTYIDENGNTQTVNVTDGKFNMPAADVTVTATFDKADLNVTVSEDITGGTVKVTDKDGTEIDKAKVGDAVTLTNTPNPGYVLDEYTVTYNNGTENKTVTVTVDSETGNATFTMPEYDVTVSATFKKADLEITINDTDNGSVVAKKGGAETETAQFGDEVTLVATPDNGYELDQQTVTYTVPGSDTATPVTVTDGKFTMPKYPVTVTTTFKESTYTITYKDGDTVLDLTPATYKISSTDKLPSPTKANYTFAGWKAEVDVGNWSTTLINPDTTLNNRYGNVTLVAQWTPRGDLKVEEYKYANTGYVMLRVANDLEDGNVYKFNGETMYYTTDSNYLVEGSTATGVYYTLISKGYAATTTNDAGETVLTGKLTDAGMALLMSGQGTQATIDYDSGDINGDDVTNIADANIVYQMIVNGGGYYGDLDTQYRLRADMVRATTDAVHRGSILDVNAIVNIINGTTN